jgi:hypothetical protein
MITILRAAAYATVVLCTCPVASSADSAVDEKNLQRTLRAYISVTAESIKKNYGPLLETAAMLAACESERATPWLGPTEEDIDEIVRAFASTSSMPGVGEMTTEISAGVHASVYQYRQGYMAATNNLIDAFGAQGRTEMCDLAETLADRIESRMGELENARKGKPATTDDDAKSRHR